MYIFFATVQYELVSAFPLSYFLTTLSPYPAQSLFSIFEEKNYL